MKVPFSRVLFWVGLSILLFGVSAYPQLCVIGGLCLLVVLWRTIP